MTLTQRLEAPRSGLIVGAGAGLAGGIVAAAVLSIVGIKGRQGEVTRAITLVSHTVGSDTFVAGWLVQIAAATALGLQRTHLVLLCHELGVRLNPRCHWGRPDCTCEQGSTCLGA